MECYAVTYISTLDDLISEILDIFGPSSTHGTYYEIVYTDLDDKTTAAEILIKDMKVLYIKCCYENPDMEESDRKFVIDSPFLSALSEEQLFSRINDFMITENCPIRIINYGINNKDYIVSGFILDLNRVTKSIFERCVFSADKKTIEFIFKLVFQYSFSLPLVCNFTYFSRNYKALKLDKFSTYRGCRDFLIDSEVPFKDIENILKKFNFTDEERVIAELS